MLVFRGVFGVLIPITHLLPSGKNHLIFRRYESELLHGWLLFPASDLSSQQNQWILCVHLVFFRGIFSCQLGDEQKNYQSHPLRICHFTQQIDLETAKNFRYPKWRVSKSPKILGYLEVVKLPLHKPYPYSLYRFSDSSILGTTPWKIDMEATNHPFRKEIDLPNLHEIMVHVNLPS